MKVLEKLSPAEISYLIKIYTFAGGPGYLYRRFRTSTCIERLAASSSTEELVETYENLYPQLPLSCTSEAFVPIYAILVALSFRPAKEFSDSLSRIRAASYLYWVDEIIQCALIEQTVRSEPPVSPLEQEFIATLTSFEKNIKEHQSAAITALAEIIALSEASGIPFTINLPCSPCDQNLYVPKTFIEKWGSINTSCFKDVGFIDPWRLYNSEGGTWKYWNSSNISC